jgi:hypothetical protein
MAPLGMSPGKSLIMGSGRAHPKTPLGTLLNY